MDLPRCKKAYISRTHLKSSLLPRQILAGVSLIYIDQFIKIMCMIIWDLA